MSFVSTLINPEVLTEESKEKIREDRYSSIESMLVCLLKGSIVENSIYVEITSKMIRNNEVLGIPITKMTFPPSPGGQVKLQWNGPYDRIYEFSIGTYIDDQYKTVFAQRMKDDTAVEICGAMMRSGKLYNAYEKFVLL
jgi:hypothetical protein